MLEVADNKPKEILKKHAVVYEHLSNLYEKQWLEVYGHLTAVMRVLIFHQAFPRSIRNNLIYGLWVQNFIRFRLHSLPV